MFEHGPSDRIQIVGRGDLMHPGSCMVCGSGNCDEGYVSLGVFYDYEGHMYLCKTCVIQVAEVIGCMIPSEVNELHQISAAIADDNAILREELSKANERLDAVNLLFGNLGAADPEPTDDVSSDAAEGDPEAEQGTVNGESEVTESVTLQKRSGPKRSELRDASTGSNGLDI